MILDGGNIGKLAAEKSRVNMREKVYNQPFRRLHTQRYKDKANETELLTQLKGLTIDFWQKSFWYEIIKFSDESIYQEQ